MLFINTHLKFSRAAKKAAHMTGFPYVKTENNQTYEDRREVSHCRVQGLNLIGRAALHRSSQILAFYSVTSTTGPNPPSSPTLDGILIPCSGALTSFAPARLNIMSPNKKPLYCKCMESSIRNPGWRKIASATNRCKGLLDGLDFDSLRFGEA